MADTWESPPFYIRTQHGQCFHVTTLEEAIRQFCADDGYRLSIKTDEHEVVIRRSSDETDDQGVHKILGERKYVATVTIRDPN